MVPSLPEGERRPSPEEARGEGNDQLGGRECRRRDLGSCCKILEPNTLKELVIKTFSEDASDDLVTDATYLKRIVTSRHAAWGRGLC